MIKPVARQTLTESDLDFVCETLGGSKSARRQAVTALLTSEHDRDLLLDTPELFKALTARKQIHPISPRLYFYILLRTPLREFGIDDRDTCDYLACMLAEFADAGRAHIISSEHQKQYQYLVDILEDLIESQSEKAFLLQSHLGNYSLWLSGFFPSRVFARAKYGRSAPNFTYYEHFGRSGYHQAARHHAAETWNLAPVFEVLSSHFRRIRHAMNYMVDNFMIMDATPQQQDRVWRRLQSFIQMQKYSH